MAAVGSRSVSCEPRDRVPTPWIACAWYLEDLLLGRGPGRRRGLALWSRQAGTLLGPPGGELHAVDGKRHRKGVRFRPWMRRPHRRVRYPQSARLGQPAPGEERPDSRSNVGAWWHHGLSVRSRRPPNGVCDSTGGLACTWPPLRTSTAIPFGVRLDRADRGPSAWGGPPMSPRQPAARSLCR